MKSLTGLDATFLYLETPEMPMHVGSFNLCALPAGLKGGFHKAVTAHISKRMHLAPVFSRKLVFMPLDIGHPLWVEADEVDIGFHIRRADPRKKGEPPMTLANAQKLCAQLHAELIDRNFPLWEFYVFDQIQLPIDHQSAHAGQVVGGFFSKIHHAALDGKGGVMLANALLDISPVPRNVPPPDLLRRRKLESDLKLGKMIGSVFSSSVGQLVKAAKSLPSAVSTFGSTLARQSSTSTGKGLRPKMPMHLAPQTPFNTGITSGRVFVTATAPLAECKAMSKAVGGTFNDIVLWICATALRNYLLQHHSLPKKSLVVAMPVSLRETGAAQSGDASHLGNQVSMSLVELGTHLAHPLKRMNAIMASTAKVKTSLQSLKGLLPTDYPSLLAPWLVGGAAKMAFNAFGKIAKLNGGGLASGLASRLPMVANLVISNVPGTPVPLYLAGAKFLSFHPLSIIVHGLGLNITVQTYAGQVDFGIIADQKALTHANDFAKAIEAAFKEAQTLLASPAVVSPAKVAKPLKKSVQTPVKLVPQVTKLAKLGSTLQSKRQTHADTVLKLKTPPLTKLSNEPSHGKSDVKATTPKKAVRKNPTL